MSQDKIVELLKKKGTGASMGKCLVSDELDELQGLFLDSSVSLITKATLLCAIVMLEATEHEQGWLDALSSGKAFRHWEMGMV